MITLFCVLLILRSKDKVEAGGLLLCTFILDIVLFWTLRVIFGC